MESDASCSYPLIQEDVLHYLIQFLDGNTLKATRLVCKQWNLIAEKEFPKRMELIAFRHGKNKPDIEILCDAFPGIFTTIDFQVLMWHGRWDEPLDGPEFEEEIHSFFHKQSCIDLLTRVSDIQAIRRLKITDGRQMQTAAVVIKHGFVLNLEDLEVVLSDDKNYEGLARFKLIPCPAPLLRLKRLSLDVALGKEGATAFYQDLINAAKNLVCLECSARFDITRLAKLEHLKLRGITAANVSLEEKQKRIQDNLLPCREKLHKLSLKGMNFVEGFLQFPNVKELKLDCVQFSAQGNECLASYFPALQRLHLNTPQKREELEFLRRGFPASQFQFQQQWLQINPAMSIKFLNELHAFAPNVKLVVCSFDQPEPLRQKFEMLLNMKFPNLVINLDETMGLVEALKICGSVEINESVEGGGEVLEIRNGKYPPGIPRAVGPWTVIVSRKRSRSASCISRLEQTSCRRSERSL